jgi:nitroreductase
MIVRARDAFDETARLALVAEANLAPSVHNIQPTRFRFDSDGAITVLEDTRRRLTVGDPGGADNWKSIGAATEGLVMALSARGFGADVVWLEETGAPLRRVARVTLSGDANPDRLRAAVPLRATWRGAFARKDAAAQRGLDALRDREDLHLVLDPVAIAAVAKLFDRVSLITLRNDAYRAELRGWMRLSRFNLRYGRDGLNARAMAMGGFEAWGAGIVLGKGMFHRLDRIGLAGPLISESAKVKSAAALGLFHRPAEEHAFVTGRRFYRLWLEIAAAGLAACPMSVLADSEEAAGELRSRFSLGEGRRLITVFRLGRRPERPKQPPRARLPAHELIVKA